MRKTIAAMTAVLGVLAYSGTASAIVFGQPDGNGHPNVGALLAPEPFPDGTWVRCSGTLISPTVFLSAAHCDFLFTDTRFVATSDRLFALNQAWLRLSQNPALGDGGTCFGDAGGPNFLGAGDTETDIIAATMSTGDSMCRATNVVYRLDTGSARSFLGQFVELP